MSESVGTSATPSVDYNIVDRNGLIFPAGQDVLDIDIPIEDDDENEDDETFRLVLTTTDASLTDERDTAIVTIKDNDRKD